MQKAEAQSLEQCEPKELERTERINGQLYLMAPAALNHNIASGSIYTLFRNYLSGQLCMALPDGTKVFLTDEENYFVPDAMIVCDRSKLRRDGVYGCPDLVVEVLSPSTEPRDRGLKKDAYENAGVREYWIVDPEKRTVEQYILQDQRLRLLDIHRWYTAAELAELPKEDQDQAAGSFRSHIFSDMDIPLETIFQDFVSG